MKRIVLKLQKKFLPAEKFFVEKAIELLSDDTIDTYRLRLNNPRTALLELHYLIKLFMEESIAEDYPKTMCDEVKDLLNRENELCFSEVDKNYVLQALGKRDLPLIGSLINIVLSDNTDYLNKLFSTIESEIIRLNSLGNYHVSEYKRLNLLISYLLVELRKQGFNKTYLHRTIRALFATDGRVSSFDEVFKILQLISQRTMEQFKVYIHFNISYSEKKFIDYNPIRFVYENVEDVLEEAKLLSNQNFVSFVQEITSGYLYSINVNAIDYYSATIQARKIVQKCLDFCFLGQESNLINISQKCFVLGTNMPSKSKSQNLNYQLDGDLKGSFRTYRFFTFKLRQLNKNPSIDKHSVEKLYSGLRYLRYGTEAQSIEHKLINYWIAIEYIFSSKKGNKITRLKDSLKKIHAYTYIRKLLVDLHNSIANFDLITAISKYNEDDINYLLADSTQAELDAVKDRYPLLAFRAFTINSICKEEKSINSEISRHMNNVERNVLRIYRIRNQIVHNAASDFLRDDIYELATHLKYYLIFVLNGLLDFLLVHPIDTNSDETIAINDYFNITSIKLDSLLSKKGLSASDMIKIFSPIEYFNQKHKEKSKAK